MPLGQVPDAHFQCLAKSLVARQVVRIIAQCSIFPATYLANAAKHRCETNCTKRVTLGNVSCNLSRNFVATKVTQLNCLLSHPATDISRNFFFSTTMFSNINRELKQQAFLRTRTSEKSREPGSRTAFLAPNAKVKRSTFLKHERRR